MDDEVTCGLCGMEHPTLHACHTWARSRCSWPPVEMVYGSAIEPGTIIDDRFRIHAVLEGRHGITRYAAQHLPLGRAVWLEVLDPACAVDPRLRHRFLTGVKLATRLPHHPHIAPVLDFGDLVQQGVASPFVVVPHQEGQSLAQRIEERGRASVSECARVIDRVLLALKHAHARGVVHRQITPSNIRIVPTRGGGETARVTGFGTSCVVGDTSKVCMVAAGPAMAPEQIAGGPVDGRTDLYAVAATAFMTLVGEAPFTYASGQRELQRAIMSHPAPSLVRARRDVPHALDAWMHRGLSKDPAARFLCAEDMRAALHAAILRTVRATRDTEPARQSTH